ncbi:MAG: lipopolysaccharide biosynthesis protein [Oscillospiraceae bacterium]|nr:lipopolysaccharide biosynthesis protein [Oscillospiraceae bacterium]
MNDRKQSFFSNLLWRFMERCGAQLVSFVVSVVLARLLDPSLYGTIALVTVITSILNVFVDSGMANALIQKKNTDDLDFSSVFYFNVVFCLLLYALLFFSAPWISRLYNNLSLVPIFRVLGLTIVISGVKNVQQAYVAKTMQFRRFFFSTLSGTILSAIVGITMAYSGFGIWALVAQMLTNAAVSTAILWLTVGWKPLRMFSLERLRGLISYGWKILVSGLLDTVYLKLYQLAVGLRYTEADLAFYNKADQLPLLVVENINTSIDSVLLPVLSAEQDSRESVREMTRRAIKTSSYIMMPLMAGLAVCAEPLIRALLTAKWLPCVPYLRVFCIMYALYPLHTANLSAIKALGRSDIFLKLEILKEAVSIGLLFLMLPFGVFAVAVSVLISGFISLIINAWPNRRMLGYPVVQQLYDTVPAVLLSAGMAAVIYPVTLLGLGDLVTLLIMVPAGIAFYVGVSALLKLESFRFLLGVAANFLHRGGAEEGESHVG